MMSPARIRNDFSHMAVYVICVAMLLSGCSRPREERLAPGSVVLALGDSITAGYGIARDRAWPAQLAARSNWTIVNAGASGDTTSGALARLPELLEEHLPKLVIVEIGGNDMLRRIDAHQIESNLRAIVYLAQQRGARVVLLGIPRPSAIGAATGRLHAAEVYADVAKRSRSMIVHDAVADVLSDAGLRLDPLHPNEEGHRRLAETIERAFRTSGLLR
ncbi:MAG TPA: arylesterase [Rhodocyclaceae bacterium]|nr:arylesterase [Rhodocyclaceae bacterium]